MTNAQLQPYEDRSLFQQSKQNWHWACVSSFAIHSCLQRTSRPIAIGFEDRDGLRKELLTFWFCVLDAAIWS
jgi:hypothetical protein